MEPLEQIIDFANKAHGTQRRKYADEPYIEHPKRVMEKCRQFNDHITILAAAILHDVLEDTDVNKKQLEAFLLTVMEQADAKQTVNLVVELTDVYVKTAYPRWNRRKRKNKEAARIEKTSGESQTIKYADIIDNTSEIVQQDPDFAKLFLYECNMLLKKINKGNQQLYREAVDSVNAKLLDLRKGGTASE